MRMVLIVGTVIGVYYFFFSDESGCSKYASNFSCTYVVEKATYDVYYWKNVRYGDPSEETYIGTVTGLINCKNRAVDYAQRIGEQWWDRSYVCMLKKDGRNLEKHRYLN
jgi:hypothetical protein